MLFGKKIENSAGCRSRVVHQNIDAPQRGVRVLDKSLGIGRFSQISRYGDDFAVCLACDLPIPALPPVTSAVFPFIWRSMKLPSGSTRDEDLSGSAGSNFVSINSLTDPGAH